jgi:hypothetical protein
MKKITLLIILLFTANILFAQTPCRIYKQSAPIVLNGVHDKEISGLEVAHIILNHCYNILIKNCKIGPDTVRGIQLERCANIHIDSCYWSDVRAGVYALQSAGILVTNCQGKNMLYGFPRGGQFVQFNEVTGARNGVLHCRFENILGQSNPEDAISMYKSSGTAASPILVEDNWIRGGGPSKSGGGIMLGDNGGSYQIARNNILVNPGQYGMAISGGHHIEILNNKIYSKQQPFTNVGLYIWAQAGAACSLNTISGNRVNWKMATGEVNNSWNNGNCGAVKGWPNNILNADIDESILPAQLITFCSTKTNN